MHSVVETSDEVKSKALESAFKVTCILQKENVTFANCKSTDFPVDSVLLCDWIEATIKKDTFPCKL